MYVSDVLLVSIVILLIVLSVLLALRELRCWYWKINSQLEELRKSTLYLEAIYKLLAQSNSINAATAEALLNGGEGGGTARGYNKSDIPDL